MKHPLIFISVRFMKSKSTDSEPIFVPYDDENMSHALAGPDYGQTNSSSAWSVIDSIEFPDFVKEIGQKIVLNKVTIINLG